MLQYYQLHSPWWCFRRGHLVLYVTCHVVERFAGLDMGLLDHCGQPG